MTQTLHDSSKYKSFTAERNKFLERIEQNTQLDISRMIHSALENITGYLSHMALSKDMTLPMMKHLCQQLDQYIAYQFEMVSSPIEKRILRMRKNVFLMTYVGELEAIARATRKTPSLNLHDFKTKLATQAVRDTQLEQTWSVRLYVNLSRLRMKLVAAFQRAVVLEKTPLDIVRSVQDQYPPIQYQRYPRLVKPVRESDRKPDDEDPEKEFDFYHGLVVDEDWDLAVQAYKDTELPPGRFDNDVHYNSDTGTIQYSWEIEQEITDDFVQQVRNGQVQAANDMGVKDFVWVAVIDKRTCEVCCLPRAGKLTSEIKRMLSSGELDRIECDAIVPPAHPFCRCDIAPVASTDEVEGADWKSFNDWVNS